MSAETNASGAVSEAYPAREAIADAIQYLTDHADSCNVRHDVLEADLVRATANRLRVLAADRAATAPQTAASGARRDPADVVRQMDASNGDGPNRWPKPHEITDALRDAVARVAALTAERDARTIPPDVAKWLEMHVCAVTVRDSDGHEMDITLERYGDSFVATLEDAMTVYPERYDEPDPCPKGDPDCETGDDGSCHDACEAPTPEVRDAR